MAMNSIIKDVLSEVLEEAVRWENSNEELVCFCPMSGSRADGRLMLVGRALYGWGTQPFIAQKMKLSAARDTIIENSMNMSSMEQGCPIQRLHESWYNDKNSKYNPRKSQFWSVAREVISHLSTPQEAATWMNYLYWTNLYKVSLKKTGNPRQSLKLAIGLSSLKALSAEIELLKPERILFLTGKWWAMPFLNVSNFKPQEIATYYRVHQTGFWTLNNGRKATVVVADHPERKKRNVIVLEILNAFEKLGRSV